MRFKDKLAIVTGATRGIGRAIVLELAKEGANAVFTYLKSDDLANSLKKEIENLGVKAYPFKIDVRDFDKVDEWKERIKEQFNRIDILINNAGIIKDGALAMMERDSWREVIDTNLNGLFNMTKAFIVTFMKQKSGNIINITSLTGIIGMPRQTNYAASKGGIIAFTKSLAKEVAPFNIRVNAVAPGFIETDMTSSLKEEHIKQIMPQIPLGRFGRPEEVAKVVSFLASDESNYITGEVIRIDGGLGM
jgi:3-oxoacyl-[acyl-carrier protein] reductase